MEAQALFNLGVMYALNRRPAARTRFDEAESIFRELGLTTKADECRDFRERLREDEKGR